jgi:hypothetical protein
MVVQQRARETSKHAEIVRRLQFKRVASANPNHSFIRTDHLHEHASTYDTRAHGEHTRETQQRLRYRWCAEQVLET